MNRLPEAEDWITDSEDKVAKNIQSEQKNGLKDLWYNIKYSNIHIVGVPEEEERTRWGTDGRRQVFLALLVAFS